MSAPTEADRKLAEETARLIAVLRNHTLTAFLSNAEQFILAAFAQRDAGGEAEDTKRLDWLDHAIRTPGTSVLDKWPKKNDPTHLRGAIDAAMKESL